MKVCLLRDGARHPVCAAAFKFAAWFLMLTSPPVFGAITEPELSDDVRAALLAINEQIAAEHWREADAALDALLQRTRAGSYDTAMVHVHRAQLALQRQDRPERDHARAIESLEHVVASTFWPRSTMLEWKRMLAQLYAVEQRLDAAEQTLEAWLAETTEPAPDAYVLLISVMLEQASREETTIARARRERALARAGEGLRLGVRPDPTLLHLRAACLQSLGRVDDAAETMEFLLSRGPQSQTRWEQLYALYANDGHDLRALLTIDRARVVGALNSPESDLARGQHFHQLAQDAAALDALEQGLQRGARNAGSHWLFAARLALITGQYGRAAKLLDAAGPLVRDGEDRHVHEQLTEALAAARN